MQALLFELNSIQSYLFASGKLRDMVGASELLDQLTNGDSEGNLITGQWAHLGRRCINGAENLADAG